MTKLAVITGSQRKKVFKKPIIINHGSHMTLELPYTVEQISTISDAKLQKTLERGIFKLKQMGITRAVFTNTLKTVLDPNIQTNGFRIVTGQSKILEFMPQMIEWICSEYSLESLDKCICIRERNLSRAGQRFIEDLCYKAKRICLVTADIFAAKRYADFLMEQFGFILEIRAVDQVDCKELGDIIVDIDNLCVGVPQECTIDGVVFEDLSFPEDTDVYDCMACLGIGANDVNVTKWKNGDNFIDIAK